MRNVSWKRVGAFILILILGIQLEIVGTNATESLKKANMGVLKISKIVEGTDSNQEFEFTVTFDVKGKYPYVGSDRVDGIIQSGDVITLKSGQSITIRNLKAGTKYTVTEEDSNLYGMAVTGQQGIITTGEIAEAEFVSALRPLIDPVPTQPVPPDL